MTEKLIIAEFLPRKLPIKLDKWWTLDFPNLVKARNNLNKVVAKLYQKEPFTSDPTRVAHLFELYREASVE